MPPNVSRTGKVDAPKWAAVFINDDGKVCQIVRVYSYRWEAREFCRATGYSVVRLTGTVSYTVAK